MAGVGEVFERTPGCITVAVTNWPPLVDVSKVPFTGTHISIFRVIMEAMNMCYWLAATPDQQWGDKLNGTWTGMIGMVARKEANIAMGPLGVTWLRTEIVDYASPYMNSGNVFLYRLVTDVQPDMLIFIKAFRNDVWLYLLSALIVVAVTSLVIDYILSRASRTHFQKSPKMAGVGEVFERTPGCITVAVTNWPPLVDVSKVPFTGTHISIFRVIMEAMNMCYWLAATPDQQWGDKLNGTWTGMIGMVARKEANIAMGPLGVTWLRTEIVDYASPYMNSGNVFLYRLVTDVQPDMLIFIKAFRNDVWLYLLSALIVVAVTSLVIDYILSRAKGTDGKKRMSAVKQLLWSIRIIMSQDNRDNPGGGSGRFFTIIWMLTALIMSLTYKCNLKAILITNKAVPPFDTMEELVNQDEYKWIIVDGTYYGGYFKNEFEVAPDTVRGRMWNKQALPPLKDATEIVPAVLASKVAAVAPALFHNGFVAVDFSMHGECRLTYTREGFHDLFLSFGHEKNSPIREKMDTVILRLIQAGLTDYITDFRLRNATWCINPPNKKGSESRPFSVEDFLGIFIIYGIGLGCATVVFVVEFMTFKVFDEKEEKELVERRLPPLPGGSTVRHLGAPT